MARTDEARDQNHDNTSVYSSFIAKAHVEYGGSTALKATATATKDSRWFLDSAASIRMTHQLEVFIEPLQPTRTTISLADGSTIEAVGVGKINLPVRINGTNCNVHISTVYYCPRLDSNLLSLGAIEAKGMTWTGASGKLQVRKGKKLGPVWQRIIHYIIHNRLFPHY